jgi:hypothetical protein
MNGILDWLNFDGDSLFPEDTPQINYEDLASDALDEASRSYFSQMLTRTLSEKFSIAPGELRCTVEWGIKDRSPYPAHVTLILSGKAIWRDPTPLKAAVHALLGCSCDIAIDSIEIGGNS